MIFRHLSGWWCLAAVCCFLQTARAASLVPLGSVWKYLDNGTDQSNAWRTVAYVDTTWASGPAQLGYGDGDEATVVGYGPNPANKYITTYFRRVFTVADPAAYTNLVLRLLRDDGAVVYLNNVEVFRSNMPGGTINYLTLASTNTGSETAFHTNNASPSVLVAGSNLIAVEVHQDAVTSSDISFELELIGGSNLWPVVSITSPIDNSTIPTPGDVSISVSAVDPDGTITNVQLFAGNVLIEQKTSAPYNFTWTNVSAGAHAIRATATDNDGLTGSSPTIKFTVGSGTVSNLVLIPYGANWKYLDNGTDQGTAWYGTNFNDTAWTNGPAQLGYGDGDEARVIGYGGNSSNKFITTYFRKTFTVTNLSAISALVLHLVVDDAAVVYINGAEALRTNLPAGGITYTTLATNSWENNFVRAILDKSILRTGTNWIAVEIHQQATNSSDLSFDLALSGSDLPFVLRGPWLQSGGWTNLIVCWRTDASVTSQVRFGTNASNLTWFVRNTALTNEHRVVLTNLAPGKKYFYSIGPTNATLLGDTNYYFTTAPLPGTRQRTRVWALGDSGTANVDQFNVRDAFYRQFATNEIDLTLLLGDNAYDAGLDHEFQRGLFDTYPTMLRQIPLWPTIGNHETAQSTNPASTIAYYQIFQTPQSGQIGGNISGTKNYYSFDYANLHFVCLDSMISSRSATGTMAGWLTNDLASTTQDWIIAFWHHPPYTKGSHDSDTELNLVEMRANILPHLEKYGVDLVLTGHSHAYERSHLLDGHYGTSGTINATNLLDTRGGRADVAGPYEKPLDLSARQGAVYVVTGSAGRIGGGTLNHPAMFLSLSVLGSFYFEVNGDRLDAQFIRETGVIQDYFTILKGGVPYHLVRVGNASRLTWNSVIGRSYTVDYKDNLSASSWTALGSTILGNGLPLSITNTTSLPYRFYRVRAQ